MAHPTKRVAVRELGGTGEKVSCLGMGGSHIGKDFLTDEEAVRLIRQAIDAGLNFLDNSWDYNDGTSERRVGKALKNGYRDRAFVMTKFDGRDKKTASKQIDESLRRLGVDHLDLLQFHEVIRFEDPDRFFSEGGAAEALLSAREQGKTRFIGFTGHKDPSIHLHMLELAEENGFRFDTVQMPLNPFDAHYRSFGKRVVPELTSRKIGVIGMKSMASGILLKSEAVTAEECLRYALSLPTSVVVTGIENQKDLDQAIRIGSSFEPLDKDEMAALLDKTKSAARDGDYELFKTATVFDETAKNLEWLGEETEQVQSLMANS